MKTATKLMLLIASIGCITILMNCRKNVGSPNFISDKQPAPLVSRLYANVINLADKTPLLGSTVVITAPGGAITNLTVANDTFSMAIVSGTYTVVINKTNFISDQRTFNVSIPANTDSARDYHLQFYLIKSQPTVLITALGGGSVNVTTDATVGVPTTATISIPPNAISADAQMSVTNVPPLQTVGVIIPIGSDTTSTMPISSMVINTGGANITLPITVTFPTKGGGSKGAATALQLKNKQGKWEYIPSSTKGVLTFTIDPTFFTSSLLDVYLVDATKQVTINQNPTYLKLIGSVVGECSLPVTITATNTIPTCTTISLNQMNELNALITTVCIYPTFSKTFESVTSWKIQASAYYQEVEIVVYDKILKIEVDRFRLPDPNVIITFNWQKYEYCHNQ